MAGSRHEQRALARSPEEILEQIGDGFVALDLDWHYTYVNRRAGELIEVDPDALVGRHIWTVFPEMVGSPMHRAAEQAMRDQQAATVEDWYPPSPEGHCYEVRLQPTERGLAMFFRDITEHRRAVDELRRSEERYRLLAHAFNNTVWRGSAGGAIVQAPDWQGLTGLDVPPERWPELVHPDDVDAVVGRWRDALGSGDVYDCTYRIAHADGGWRHVRARGIPVRVDGEIREWVGVITDVTASVQGAEALRRAALEDPLTGLPNRTLFLERVAAAARRRVPHTAVVFVDLDRFKTINDRFGHATGDRLLRAVAERLSHTVRPSDVVSRLSGDEFAILCDDLPNEETAVTIAGRIATALNEPLDEDARVRVSASIGVAFVENAGADEHEDAEAVLRAADAAMYHAKSRGGASVEVLEDRLRSWLHRRALADRELQLGLHDGGLHLHFQPIVALDRSQRVTVEALLRWKRPGGPAISAPEVIAAAEQNGLIWELGRGVLGEACRQAATWNAAGSGVRVSVNVSARQLARSDELLADVEEALQETGLHPGLLTLEITETVLMENMAEGEDAVGLLRDAGVRVAIDDFGVGYSSLSYLHRLPVDAVKLDRSFVAGLPGDPGSARIVEAVVGLARAFDIGVIAEGIENVDQLAAVRAAGCMAAQGYALSRPAPPEVLGERVSAAVAAVA